MKDVSRREEGAPADGPGQLTPSGTIPRRFGLGTTSLLVMASMIGTGAFTTSGFLIRDLGSPLAVILAWLVGGVAALFGALAYAELGAALPKNGGEAHLLSRIYHPSVGFVAGWVSLVVGFSAPMAASALAFGEYTNNVIALPPVGLALFVIVSLSALHAFRVELAARVQNWATVLDVGLILLLIGVGLAASGIEPLGMNQATAPRETFSALLSPEFAVGLIFVSFSYSGWNAAAYLAGEVRNPKRTLPRALMLGTGVVCILYVGLNLWFVSAAPPEALSGAIDVAAVAARASFGEQTARWVSLLVALGLFTTVSALVVTGSRVYESIGRDYPKLRRSLGRARGHNRGPLPAIALQAVLACGMVLGSSFEVLLTYIGFLLSLFAGLTVLGLFVLRRREPGLERPYRAWGHPVTSAVMIALSAWMMIHAAIAKPIVLLTGAITLAIGGVLYLWLRSPVVQTPAGVKAISAEPDTLPASRAPSER